ncbi:Plipastatin synthase subunit D [BD1-7 clade bacterium]|uniref:Plipastatin synthase subunit D n=1 Tax=BD1-7 clade bacterium TaxID=2029982 RepID=A0A5S9P6A3_9GAMM|nr:Plipastatin synthase subunit D [BD1-7 clade bacterium]
MFVHSKTFTQVEDDGSLGELVSLSAQFSERLDTVTSRGVLALCGLPDDIGRLLVIGAWHAGWQVAMVPEHFSVSQRQVALQTLQPSLLIARNETLIEKAQVLSLVLETDCDTLALDHWLGDPSDTFSLASGYRWDSLDTALILFTSGSSGTPKGVCHSLQNIVTSANRFIDQFQLHSSQTLLNCAESHTMSGFRGSIMLPLMSACTIYDGEFERDLAGVLTALEESSANVMIIGPSLVRQMARIGHKLTHLNQHLSLILCTGARLAAADKQHLYQTTRIMLLDYYGLTETGGLVIAESAQNYQPESSSLGSACDDVDIVVVDKDGNESPFGIGELRIYTTGLFLGYFGGSLTQRRYFDTGDCVHIHESGNVEWLYRINRGFKSASTEWIFPDAVESWLKNNTRILDANVTPIIDDADRVRFDVHIKGIAAKDFEAWSQTTRDQLVAELGSDYDILTWHVDEQLQRTGLGKHHATANTN